MRSRLLAAATLSVIAIGLLSMLGGVASAASGASTPPKASKVLPTSPYNSFDSGMWNSQIQVFNKAGQLVLYGDSFVEYRLPPAVTMTANGPIKTTTLGKTLYEENCSICHGVHADGVPPAGTPGSYPNLLGLGPATYDFWVVSGRMPAYDTHATQEPRRPAKLSSQQAEAIAAYLNSLDPATPYIPVVNLKGADLADGAALFAVNCAACHTITGDGDALANDTFAPSLRHIPAYEVAEALRTGPANMPVFSGNLTDQQLRDVVAYVVGKIQHPENPGGLGLGGLGPVGEGFVGLALGVGLLAVVGFWVGDRS